MAHGPEFGHAFEEFFLFGRGRDGIGRTGARHVLLALPIVVVVVANHGGPPKSGLGKMVATDVYILDVEL
jgi:hypothetical protein